jgi:hypothetical protein
MYIINVMSMTADSQIFYAMLSLSALYGLTQVAEGVYRLSHYESGWVRVFLGGAFLSVVAFGYFYLKG